MAEFYDDELTLPQVERLAAAIGEITADDMELLLLADETGAQ
ncbi:MAG TPA: hypothetical protein VGE30_01735 [Candidatus Saccharimonadales bacterium]